MAIDIKETFQVQAPIDLVWRFLLDPQQVAPCMPGAELDEVCRHLQVAESTWHRWLAQCGGLHVFSAQVGHAPVDRQVRDRVAS